MKIEMAKSQRGVDLPAAKWDLGFFGRQIDERGTQTASQLRNQCKAVQEITYSPDSQFVKIGGQDIHPDELADFLPTSDNVLALDATTLGFVEIFLIAKAMYHRGLHGLSLLYAEPGEYRRKADMPRQTILDRRAFELSDDVLGYRAVPSASFIIDDKEIQRSVFFLGYEERRLDRALEDYPLSPSHCSLVFGVPAFQAGWEMDAFANNIGVIDSRDVSGGVHFCGAENPAAAYKILEDTERECTADTRLFVGPIGTKPHGIASALFAATRPNVGVLYDHPSKSKSRSSKLGNWHLFRVTGLGQHN